MTRFITLTVNDRQKKALTAFSLFIVLGGTAYVVWLAVAVIGGDVRGNVWPGKFLMLLVADWNSVTGAFKGLGALVAVGVAYIGSYKMKDWLFYAIVAISAVGLGATTYLFFEVASVSTAKSFWAYSPVDNLQDYHSFVTAARVGLGVLSGWFIGVLASELGVRLGSA